MLDHKIDSKKIRIRDYTPGDENGIALLFSSSDPRHPRNISYWRWSNSDSVNKDFLSAVAEYEGKIVAHYSLMGIDVLYGTQVWKVGFGQQAVVHKNFRNLTVVCELAKHIFTKAQEKYEFLYAFPNNEFFPIKTTLLGWQAVGVFGSDAIDLDTSDFKKNHSIGIKPIFKFDSNIYSATKDNNKDHIYFSKNPAFLNWRFFSHPLNYYFVFGAYDNNKNVGYIVLKFYYNNELRKNIGHIVDYEVKDSDINVLSSLLYESKNFFLFNDVKEIVFWNRNLRNKDFFDKVISKQNSGFMTNFGLLLFDQKKCNVALDLGKWSFTMANSDAF